MNMLKVTARRLIHGALFALLLNAISGAADAYEGNADLPGKNLLASAVSGYSARDYDPGESSEVETERLELGELFEAAFRGNPSIASARAEWRAAVEMYPQATSWPDPTLNVTVSSDLGFELMQMIPNPRRQNLMGDRALTMAEMARVRYEKTVRDVLVDVMRSYFELGYQHRAVEIAETNRDLFAQLVELADLRYAQNEIPMAELSAVESRLAQAEYEVHLLTELIMSEEANMRFLLGVAPDYRLAVVNLPHVETVSLEREEIRNRILEYRQELEMAGIAVDAAEVDFSIARSERGPDFSIGLMYNSMSGSSMNDGMQSSGGDTFGVMLGVTIPLWEGKNRAREEEAEARLDAARSDLDSERNRAFADADRIYWQLQNQARLVELYRKTLLPQAAQAAELAQTWYEQEQVSFMELVESRMVVENFELATARAEADYLETVAELGRLIGAPVMGWNSGGVEETTSEETQNEEGQEVS